MAMGGACRGAAGRPRRPAYPIKVIICLFIDPIERAVPQLTGIPATAAPTTSGTVRHRRGGTVPDPDCARAGLPRSRHRSRGGEPPGQARDSINDYRRSEPQNGYIITHALRQGHWAAWLTCAAPAGIT